MKTAATAFALLLSSLTLAAQNSAKNEGQAPVQGCHWSRAGGQRLPDQHARQPGSLGPHHQGSARATGTDVFSHSASGYFSPLGDSQPASIVAATCESARPHRARTTWWRPTAPRTPTVTRRGSSKSPLRREKRTGVSTDLYIPGFTAVNSIELLDVSYDDGRVWRIGSSSVCRVTPDPLMLIANH